MKKIIAILLFSICTFVLHANVAQPGLREAGGANSYTLLFEEDSSAYKKIQMKEERISVQLYKGYAVIKGEYWMHNHSEEDIVMKAGYPINATYATHKNASDLTEIKFRELYAIRVFSDGNKVDVEKKRQENPVDSKLDIYEYGYDDSEWYIWQNKFPSASTTKIDVYFIMNTNQATVREGYDGKDYNGFIYVFETGASWKPPIGKGKLRIQMMDGMDRKDIHGVSSTFNLGYSRKAKILEAGFHDLIPEHEDNFVMTYSEKIEGFNFENVVENKEVLFNAIDRFSTSKEIFKNEAVDFPSPFDIPNTGSFIVGLVFFLGVFGIPLLGLLFVIYLIYRLVFKKRKKSPTTI